MTTTLYNPTDRELAFNAWDATCGPAAFAALIGREVNDVRENFQPNWRGWCNSIKMRVALQKAGRPWRARWDQWPDNGLAWILFVGPWSEPGVPIGAQLRHSHWVAVRGDMVYDVNAELGWLPREQWEKNVIGWLIKETPKATGWKVRLGLEVRP